MLTLPLVFQLFDIIISFSLTGKTIPVFVQFKPMEENIQRNRDVEKICPKELFTIYNDCSVFVDI